MPSNVDVQKLLELFKSGRYQCDMWFYENLIQLANQLELFEAVPSLEKNLQHVKKIHQLTLENSDSLNDSFDEQKALENTEQIKRSFHQIKAQEVIEIISHIQKQGFKSYSQHCAQLIKKYNYHPKYYEIVKNIINTVYDPKLKVDYILISTLFMIRNTDKIEEMLSVYDKAIENGLTLMKQLRKKLPKYKILTDNFVQKLEGFTLLQKQRNLEQSQRKVMQKLKECLQQIQTYFHGTAFIFFTLQKICDIAKILEQKNNFTLKLNSYKPDIETILALSKRIEFNKNQLMEVENRMADLPAKELKGMFLGQKVGADKINRCCRICLRYVQKQDGVNETGDYHKVCQQVIKQLMTTKSETKQ